MLAAAISGDVSPAGDGALRMSFESSLSALDVPKPKRRQAIAASSVSTVTPPQLRPLNVLLAEDSLVNLKLATGLMQNHGHRVIVANNGREALAAIETNEFDLVLMDVQMPIVDGISATKAIREREKSTKTRLPIIALTAHAMKGDRELCLSAGMDGYVTKPVRAGELFRAIESLLGEQAVLGERIDLVPSYETNDAMTAASPQHDAASAGLNSMPLNGTKLDLSVAMEAVQGDKTLLKEMIQAFLDECPGLIDDIHGAIDRRDGAALRLFAHRLKGSMRYFGATRAFDQAYILETLGRDGDLRSAAEPLAAVRQEIAHLRPALEACVASLN
jgi:CheY-like chemotaxis protein